MEKLRKIRELERNDTVRIIFENQESIEGTITSTQKGKETTYEFIDYENRESVLVEDRDNRTWEITIKEYETEWGEVMAWIRRGIGIEKMEKRKVDAIEKL